MKEVVGHTHERRDIATAALQWVSGGQTPRGGQSSHPLGGKEVGCPTNIFSRAESVSHRCEEAQWRPRWLPNYIHPQAPFVAMRGLSTEKASLH